MVAKEKEKARCTSRFKICTLDYCHPVRMVGDGGIRPGTAAILLQRLLIRREKRSTMKSHRYWMWAMLPVRPGLTILAHHRHSPDLPSCGKLVKMSLSAWMK